MQTTRPFLIHALSPLHAGTGQSVDIIDLPIARLRSTGIPFLPGSSIKGVLREHHTQGEETPRGRALFGPGTADAGDHAGALIVGDARLLAMPVRSFRGTFALVTSPLLLQLAQRDWSKLAAIKLPAMVGRGALVSDTSINDSKGTVYLEDLDLKAAKHAVVKQIAELIEPFVEVEGLARRLVIVDDETMTFLWETATQIDTRIRLDPTTRTVARGALWMEESLPAESLLIGVMGATNSRYEKQQMSAAEALHEVFNEVNILQFGGKATVGRGRCRVIGLPEERR
jgi:CRISPR-associated protein Cmr4